MDREAFSELVADALDSLPELFLERMVNVEVLIEDWPTRDDLEQVGLGDRTRDSLLGLYQGVPLTHRGEYYSHLPDTITIYQKPIERLCRADGADEIRAQVRKTVIHEIAHYYGISDDRLEELGYA